MEDLKFYTVSDSYIQFLRTTVDRRVFANEDVRYVHTRKYLGIVITISGYNYYAPLSSPKNTDYLIDEDGNRTIRKSIIPIIRIVETDSIGNKTLLGTIKISNMIPVPASELTLYDIEAEADLTYKDLVNKEIRYINRHTPDVLKSASVLYRQKTSGLNIGYLSSTLDFKLLEQAHDKFFRST